MARSSSSTYSARASTRSARPGLGPREESRALFASPLESLAFALLCVAVACAPALLSGLWAVSRDVWPQALALLGALGVCFLLALCGTETSPRRAAVSPLSPLAWCLLGFAACTVLSLALASYKHDALIECARLASALIWFPIARRLLFSRPEIAREPPQVLQVLEEIESRAERAKMALLCASVALGATWVCGVATLSFVGAINPDLARGPQQAGYTNTNLFAFCAAMSLPLCAAAWLLARPLARANADAAGAIVDAAGAMCVIVCACGLLVSFSKGGLLAGVCGAVAFGAMALSARRSAVASTWRARRKVLIPLAIVGAIGLGALSAKTVAPRILGAGGSQSHSALFRLFTWRGTLAMANASPVVGHGPGSFPTDFSRFARAGYTRAAHQSWLQIAAESGWPSLLFLLGAIGCGLRGARKYLGARHRPHRAWAGAGAGAALVAGLVHGATESGWGILSIALLFSIALALLDAPPDPQLNPQAPQIPQVLGGEAERRPLNILWLLPMVPLALAASYSLHAQSAENGRASSREAFSSRGGDEALRVARAATEEAPLDARAWANRAQVCEALGDRLGASLDYGQAARLQPHKASHALQIARLFDEWNRPESAVEYFDQAISLAPTDTTVRLARARFRARNRDLKGARADFEEILRLQRGPVGLHPATPEIVNGDFNRARLALALQARDRGDLKAARELARDGLGEIQSSRATLRAESNRSMLRAVEMYGEGGAVPGEDELSAQERAFAEIVGAR